MDLTTLTLAELQALFAEKHAAFLALQAKTAPTVADIEAASELAVELTAIRDAESKFDSISKVTFDPKKAEEPKGQDKPEPEQPEGAEKVIADADEVNDNTTIGGSGTVTHEETVSEQTPSVEPGNVAGDDGGEPLQTNPEATRASAVETLAAKGTRPDVPAYRRNTGGVQIVAAADLGLTDVASGQQIDMLKTAEAVLARATSFAPWNEEQAHALQARGVTQDLHQVPTASFQFAIDNDLMVSDRMNLDQIDEVLDRAVDESSLPGGSLVAAGGWCAPSEQVYDLTTTATNEGMLSLPEVGVRRGGLKWPIAPNFAAFYANPGFIQTETQAIAGTTKPCVQVDCPSFDEKRLGVEGLCVKVPILTNVGYPEYVRFFVENTLIAHQHWMNANYITDILAIATAAKTMPAAGSTTNDLLNGLDVMAERVRQTYKLSFNATMEVILPHWVLGALRADISNRSALAIPEGLADAKLQSLFRERKLNVQFVYDWQELPLADVGGTAGYDESVAYPQTFQALMYPAGTLFKGTAPVINLNTVYDAASLAVNMYTGLFTEQGYFIGKRRFHVERLTFAVCNAGRTGSSNITACY